jgi:hypothetical protein
LQDYTQGNVFTSLSLPLPVALSFAFCLVMGKHNSTALCHTCMYQSGGIVVGTFNLL